MGSKALNLLKGQSRALRHHLPPCDVCVVDQIPLVLGQSHLDSQNQLLMDALLLGGADVNTGRGG